MRKSSQRASLADRIGSAIGDLVELAMWTVVPLVGVAGLVVWFVRG